MAKLKQLQAEQDAGAEPVAGYTVRRAIDDWLEEGLDGRSARTVRLNRDLLKPMAIALGDIELRKLTAQHVRRALNAMARDHRNAVDRSARTPRSATSCFGRRSSRIRIRIETIPQTLEQGNVSVPRA